MTDNLIAILDSFTPLQTDIDLFYLEMPAGKSGLWFADTTTTKVPTGYKDYDVYYRGKTKQSAITNLERFNASIDDMEECTINGVSFKLSRLFEWDYLEKDTEGYFVFANTLRLL